MKRSRRTTFALGFERRVKTSNLAKCAAGPVDPELIPGAGFGTHSLSEPITSCQHQCNGPTLKAPVSNESNGANDAAPCL